MLPRGLTVTLVSLGLVARVGGSSPIQIEIRGERVSIRAEKVPLVQVLNGVAWESKMKIVYDTEPPQNVVSVDLKNMLLREAITELLRGHGLVYIARMDPTGTRVDTLVLTNGAAGNVRITDQPVEQPPQDYVPQEVPFEMPPEIPPEMQPSSIPSPTPPPPSTSWQPAPVNLPGAFGPDGAIPAASPTPQYQNGYQPGMHPGMGSSMGHPMRGHGMPGMQPGMEYQQPPPQPTEYVPPPQEYFPPPEEQPTPYP
jgi:hypothetical protein